MRAKLKFLLLNAAVVSGIVLIGFAACGDLEEGECDPELGDRCVCDEDGENCEFAECDPSTEDCICDEDGENCVYPPDDNNIQAAQVSIENYSFNPDTVTIAVGGSVTWTNNSGGEQHAPDSGSDGVIACSLTNDGDVCTVVFNTAGTFIYGDRLHPDTVPQGVVIVE